MADYVAHLADDARPNWTACGEPWQGWQAPEDHHGTVIAPQLPPRGRDRVRQCQACMRVAMRRTTVFEQLEHDVVQQLGLRVARAEDVGAPLAKTAIYANLARDTDEPLTFGQWMAIATIAAKQAVILRANESRAPS